MENNGANRPTIEQIDALRERANLTYEEAIEMLERMDGDVARCMVELERTGRIPAQGHQHGWSGHAHDAHAQHHTPHTERPPTFVMDGDQWKRWAYARLLVRKDERVIINLPAAFLLFAVIVAPHLMFIGVLLAFLMGCRIKWIWGRKSAGPVDLHGFAEHAAENIRRTADSVASTVREGGQAQEDAPQAEADDTTPQDA